MQRPECAPDRRWCIALNMLARDHVVKLCTANGTSDAGGYIGDVQLVPFDFVKYFALWPHDIVICQFWTLAAQIMSLARSALTKFVIDSVDLHFAREEAALKLGIGDKREVKERKRTELETYRQAHGVIVASADDEALLRKHGIDNICVVPIVTTLRTRVIPSRKNRLLFVGSFEHSPNVDGLLWFCREIFPLVLKRCPDARLNIIGRGHVPPEVEALGLHPAITLLGEVPNMEPWLDRTAVSIAPLRFGAGMKAKVVEAMASGIPVVTTSFGAQGIGGMSGEYLLIDDKPTQFADSVICLLEHPDLAESLGFRGQKHIDGICGTNKVGPVLQNFIASL